MRKYTRKDCINFVYKKCIFGSLKALVVLLIMSCRYIKPSKPPSLAFAKNHDRISFIRDVAQLARARGSGPRGRRFKSFRPDHPSSLHCCGASPGLVSVSVNPGAVRRRSRADQSCKTINDDNSVGPEGGPLGDGESSCFVHAGAQLKCTPGIRARIRIARMAMPPTNTDKSTPDRKHAQKPLLREKPWSSERPRATR
jgi:hypothetical protein